MTKKVKLVTLLSLGKIFKKEDSCRLNFSFVLSDILTFYSDFFPDLAWSQLHETFFLFVRNNVSRELQKNRLQNMKLQQEASSSLMLFLDAM